VGAQRKIHVIEIDWSCVATRQCTTDVILLTELYVDISYDNH
jgi:hypothetical protein